MGRACLQYPIMPPWQLNEIQAKRAQQSLDARTFQERRSDVSGRSTGAWKVMYNVEDQTVLNQLYSTVFEQRDRSPPTVTPSRDAPARAIYTSTEYSLMRSLDGM